jgi:hypothetical protein
LRDFCSGLVDELDHMSAQVIETSDFRDRKIALNHGDGEIPALGFGTLIPDPAVTISATRNALEVGFRHFDCAERYRNEREVGIALEAGLATGVVTRADVFVTTKVWNCNHRPERVKPAFEASLERVRARISTFARFRRMRSVQSIAFRPGTDSTWS